MPSGVIGPDRVGVLQSWSDHGIAALLNCAGLANFSVKCFDMIEP